MSDDLAQPTFVYDGLYPAEDKKSVFGSFADLVSGAAKQVHHGMDSLRKPGMPLSVISNVAREAPLASLLAAFVLGATMARRR